MIRPSRLNDAQHCGLAASIDDQATTLPGLIGDAFHAAARAHFRPTAETLEARATALARILGDADEVADMLGRLVDVEKWTPPADAEFEVPIGLTVNATHTEPGDPEALTAGTADCTWVDGDELVVLDFKSGQRAAFDVPIPRDNLQLAAYGLALADRAGKTKMRLGLYLARDGKWLWDLVDLDTAAGTTLWERVRSAALRDPHEAVIGPHCSDCWVRLRCPTHLLPALSKDAQDHALAPMQEPAEGLIEPAKLMRMLQACQAMDALADAGRDWLKAYVKQNGPIVVGDQQWGPIEVRGKESTSVKALKEAGLYDRAVAVGAVRQGAVTSQHRWTKVRIGGAA